MVNVRKEVWEDLLYRGESLLEMLGSMLAINQSAVKLFTKLGFGMPRERDGS